MREIKFRAWDAKTGRFLKPWPDGLCLFGETTCFDLIYGQLDADPGDRLLRFGDLVVEQYTGLRDKDGKDVYEGDVIQSGSSVGSVVYSGDRFRIKWSKNPVGFNDILEIHLKKEHGATIIASIHDRKDA